jgi:hypothetical protein
MIELQARFQEAVTPISPTGLKVCWRGLCLRVSSSLSTVAITLWESMA